MAIPITRAEYQSKFGQQPPQPTQGKPIPITRAEYQAKFGQQPPQQPTEISIEAPRGGGMESIDQWHQEQTDKLMRAYQSGQISGEKMHEINQQLLQEAQGSTDREKPILLRAAEATEERIEKGKEADVAGMKGEQTFFESGAQIAGQMAGWFGDMGALAVSEAIPESVKEGGEDAIASFMETEAGQQVAEKAQEVQKWAEENPRAARNLAAAGNLLSIVPTTGGAGAGVKVGTRAAREAGELGLDVAELGARSALGTAEGAQGLLRRGASAVEKRLGVEKQVDDVIGEVLQGETKDKAAGIRALSTIDTEGVETFEDLSRRLDEAIPGIAKEVDEKLSADTSRRTIQDLATTTTSASGREITTNYVQKSLDDLAEMYEKINDPVKKADVEDLIDKANTQGLTRKEVNDISREYNNVFGRKAFSKKGDPLTSVNAQAYENTRKGLKEVAREGLPGEQAKVKDKMLSDIYNTKRLIEKNAEAVNRLKQKAEKMGLGRLAVRKIIQALDALSLGATRAIRESLIQSNIGRKTMNYLDLEEALQKNLKTLRQAESQTDPQKITDKLRESINLTDEFQPRSGLLRRAKEGKISAGMSMRDVSDQTRPTKNLTQEASGIKIGDETDRGRVEDVFTLQSGLQQYKINGEWINERLVNKVDAPVGLTEEAAVKQIRKFGEDEVEKLKEAGKGDLIDDDGYITLYHGGRFKGDKIKADDDGIFFLTDKASEAAEYANLPRNKGKGGVTEIKVRPEFVRFNEGSGEFEISTNLVKKGDRFEVENPIEVANRIKEAQSAQGKGLLRRK
jgi:hypothetical protein